jgi:hypothetical protein
MNGLRLRQCIKLLSDELTDLQSVAVWQPLCIVELCCGKDWFRLAKAENFTMKIICSEVRAHCLSKKFLVSWSKGCGTGLTPSFLPLLILLGVTQETRKEILQSGEALSRKLCGCCRLEPDQPIS